MTRPILSVILAWLLAAPPALAVTCTVGVSPAAFGSYNPLSPVPTDTTASVTTSCTTTVSILVTYSISLSAGSGSIASRAMASGQNRLAYQMYTDSARSQVWGDGSAGSGNITSSYLLAALATINRSATGYGRIPARQNVMPGQYADTLVVTLSY